MKTDFTSIIKEVRTKEDLRILRAGVEALEMNLYGVGIKSWNNVLDKVLPEKFSVHLKDLTVQLRPEQQSETIRELLSDLKKAINKFKTLKIDLAFEPTNEIIDQINFWVDEELGLETVLDLGYEKTLIGGVRMVYGGRYGDFSIAKSLEDKLSREKGNILKEIMGRSLSQ